MAYTDHLEILQHLFYGIKTPLFEIGIAGSFALWCYMTFVLQMPEVSFIPNDCDVYICCPTRTEFRHVLRRFSNYLKNNAVQYRVTKFRYNKYTAADYPLYIRDYKFRGNETNISFIHDKHATTLRNVIEQFDMNIVQVILYFWNNFYDIQPNVRSAILSKQVTVIREFIFENNVPDKPEVALLLNTYRRMIKYKKRGFAFTNTPLVSSLESNHPTNQMAAVIMPEHDDDESVPDDGSK